MAEPMFDMVLEGADELLGTLDTLENLLGQKAFEDALIDAAEIVEGRAKEYLRKFIYDIAPKGEIPYVRKMGAGLFGKTLATKKFSRKTNELSTAVGSFVKHAVYVHYGTGIFAADGKGRKTPWIYEDANGRFHKTVGQKPKPYLVNALMDSRDEILNTLGSGIQDVLNKK